MIMSFLNPLKALLKGLAVVLKNALKPDVTLEYPEKKKPLNENFRGRIKYIKEKLARAACKAAVKGGDKLTDGDIEYLKKHLDKSSALRCPHGRPVMVKITRYEIEKWFKRVV